MKNYACISRLGLALLLWPSLFQSHGALVGYWTFDEGQGTTIADTSGYGNNGTLVGATASTWTRGRVGSALYFDGTSATGVYVPNSPSLQLSNAASFAAWVRCDNPNAAPMFSKEGDPPSHLSYWFGVSGGHFGAQLDRDGAQPWDFSSIGEGNIIAGQWIHLAATWDGATVRYYTNGVPLPDTSSFTGPIFLGTARLGIGVNSEYGNYRFTGAIDEVRIYNHALSPAEVSALAAMGQTPARTLPAGLVAAYNANGTAADSSGGGADGSFTGPYVPGISGQAFWIDSQAHNFGAPAPNLPTGSAPRTMSWWVNIQGDPGPHDASVFGEWLGYGGGGNNQQYAIGYFNDQEGSWQQNQIIFTQVGWGFGGPVLATNTWYYVAVTYDGSNLKMYVNGVYYSSASYTLATPTSGNSLWCSYKNPDFYADNIRIYDAALTPAQILDDYNILEVSNSVPAGPVQWRVADGGNGHWYEAVAPGTDLNWAAAQSAAAARGGYLACVTSAAENNFIFGLINWPKYWETRSWGRIGPWLGGAYSYTPPTVWSWVSGEAWSYANWCAGEPDYYGGGDDRVVFATMGNANPPYQPTWGDNWHTDTSPSFVVEYNNPPGTPIPAPPGLVGWWPGDGNAYDLLGIHNGTLNSGATYAPGMSRQAFSLDGNTAYVDLGQWSVGAAWSWGAWVKPSSIPSGRRTIVGGVLDCLDWGLTMQDGVFGVVYHPSRATCTQTLSSGINAVAGQWYYVAGTCDGATVRVYINGQPCGSAVVELGYSGTASGTRIGSEAANAANSFPGLVADVVLFNRALTDGEAASIYGTGSTGLNQDLMVQSQPQPAAGNAGGSVGFLVTVSSSHGPVAYQWRQAGVPLAGATNAALVLTNLTAATAGTYDVVVTNLLGDRLTSQTAALTVNGWPAQAFADDFSAGINPAWWNVQSNQALYSVDATHGDVRFSKPAGGSYGFQWVDLVFRPVVRGNFDVQVDYRNARISRYDGSPGNQVQLNLSFGGQSVSLVRSDEGGPGQNHHIWNGSFVAGQSDSSINGTMRITRVGSHVTAYINGTDFYEGDYNSGDMTLSLSLQNNGTTDATTVAFDNFRVSADLIQPALPLIASQPTNQVASLHGSASFAVGVSGAPPLTYQWRFQGANLAESARIAGVQSNTLAITNLSLSDSGAYSVVVSNGFGSTTSADASLTVQRLVPVLTWSNPDPVLYGTVLGSNQLNATANVPGTAVFVPPAGTALDAGTNPLMVAFSPNNNAEYAPTTGTVSLVVAPAPLVVTANSANRAFGQTNPLFSGTLTGVISGDLITAVYDSPAVPASPPGVYPIVPRLLDPRNRLANYTVAGTNGQLMVGPAPPPAITGITPTFGPPAGGTPVTLNGSGFQIGAAVFFGAAGSPSVTVTSPYRLTAVTPPGTNGSASVRLVNPDEGTVTLAGAFSYAAAPAIQTQPTNQAVPVGGGVMFNATATGTPPLSYHWQWEGVNLSDGGKLWGAWTPFLTLTNLVSTNAGNYRLVVSNAYGWAASAVAQLNVLRATPVVTWPVPAAITYGTALNTNQLNASASTPGSFAYIPSAGTVPDAGSRTLVSIFTPTDTTHYDSVTSGVALAVSRAPLLVIATNASRAFGAGNPTFYGGVFGAVNRDLFGVSLACAAVPASPPGSYPILPTLLDPNGRAGNYYVTNRNGALTVNPQTGPSISLLSPPAGPTNGGTPVILFGSGFEVGATVAFGTNPAPTVVVSGPNNLTATTPAAPSGPVAVTVFNPDGTSAAKTNAFTYGVAPIIEVSPTNQSVVLAGTVQFRVWADGDAPLSYQWQVNGVDLTPGPRVTGVWTNVLTIFNLTPGDAGVYRVFVQNAFGRAQSAEATLTVVLPPTIAVQPQSQASGPGGGAAFTVGAAGTQPLAYQWYQDGWPLAGATSSTLVLSGIQATNAGAYTVSIANAAGSVTSQVAQLAFLTHCASVSVAQPAYAPGATIPLNVRTYDCASSTAVPDAPVVVWIFRAGAARQLTTTTSISGLGVAQFNPLPGEMGAFQFGVALPGQGAPVPTGAFTVLGMAAGSADLTSRLVVGFPQTYSITLTNPTLVGLNGITATAVGLPPNVKMQVISVPAVISGGNTAVATVQLSALNTSYTQGSFTLQFGSVEGALVSLRVNVTITQLMPQLVATPDTLVGSMVGGGQTLVSFEVANVGATDSGDLQVLIPSVPWMSLVTTQVVASLAPGQSNLVTLALTPDLALPLGAYPGQITLAGTNSQVVVPFNFNCVSTLRGALQVTAQDQLSLLAAGAPNVSNATVTVTDFLTGTQVGSGVTDDTGLLLFTNLVSAYYTIRVEAPEHGSFQTTFLLAAEQTNALTAFLPLQLVSYTWTVVPTQVADSYDFTLTTTFQTQVPWPVLTVSPGAIDLCQWVGDTNQLLLTVTNSGLIAAQNVQLVFGDNPDWLLVPLVSNLGDVAAESAVVVPVTVIRLGGATDGVPSHIAAQVNWSVVTPSQTFYNTTPVFVYNANPNDCVVHSTPVVTLTGSSGGSSGGGGGGGWTAGSGFSASQPIVSTPSYSFPPPAQGAVVQVKLQIDQTAVITRNAFKATLQLDNGASSTISNLSVTLNPVDAAGQPATNAFFTQAPKLSGINAVDGTGTMAPGANGTAAWTLIPTRSAAPLGATNYAIGGTLAYTFNGDQVNLPLFAVPITVLPDPRLEVDYFLEHDVYSDDPFTPAVEPSIPFYLGVMMRNAGLGAARKVTITSAQPTIVDNDNGLLVAFQIVGSEAGTNASVAPSLTLNLGDIPPGANALGLWAMTCSLEGSFIDFNASYQHTDALGGTDTSLIDTVTTHLLTHVVQTPWPLDDGIPDFLANDSTNVDALPNHLYASDGSVSSVTALTDSDPAVFVSGVPSSSNPTTTICARTGAPGYIYLEVADPADGTLAIANVRRADGSLVMMDRNVWQTPRRMHMVPPQSRNLVHLFDYSATGTNFYTVTYGLPPAPPQATTLLAVLNTALSATLNAQVNPGGASTTVLFQWGPSPALGRQTVTTTLNQTLNSDQVVGLPITDLLPGQTIYFQVVAANLVGNVTGAVQTLSISAQPPAVATGAASALTSTNVTLNAPVNAQGAATQVYFQWGFTSGYGNFSPTNFIGTNLNADLPVAIPIGPTVLGQTYHYRAVALNTSGVMWGADYVVDVRPSARIVLNGDGTLTLGGLAIMDRTHTLWGTTNLGPSAVWRPIATGIQGLDGTWEFSAPTPPPPPKLYYRISTP